MVVVGDAEEFKLSVGNTAVLAVLVAAACWGPGKKGSLVSGVVRGGSEVGTGWRGGRG